MVNVHNINFKGNWDHTQNGNSYYKTKAGTVMGAIGAVSCVLDGIADTRKTKGVGLVTGLMPGGIALAVGMQVDKSRNQKTAEATDYIKKVEHKKLLQNAII